MEEGGRSPREEAAEPQESGGDAEPGGGRRALLLPPGDPPHPHPHPHRITNFFIDNILRPEFGRRKEAGGTAGEPRRPGAESRRSPAVAAPAPGAPVPGGGGEGGGGGGGSPGRGEGGPAALALHGAAKKGGDPAALEAALKARGLSGAELSVSSDSDSSQAGSNAGNQPMLWPAWVYCTRYSDRPSSGKSLLSSSHELGSAAVREGGRKKIPRPRFARLLLWELKTRGEKEEWGRDERGSLHPRPQLGAGERGGSEASPRPRGLGREREKFLFGPSLLLPPRLPGLFFGDVGAPIPSPLFSRPCFDLFIFTPLSLFLLKRP